MMRMNWMVTMVMGLERLNSKRDSPTFVSGSTGWVGLLVQPSPAWSDVFASFE